MTNPLPPTTESCRAEYAAQGYCILQQALSTGPAHASAILAAYAHWFAELHHCLWQSSAGSKLSGTGDPAGFAAMPLTARFATLLGLAGEYLLTELSRLQKSYNSPPKETNVLPAWNLRHWQALLTDPELLAAVGRIGVASAAATPQVQPVFCLQDTDIALMDRRQTENCFVAPARQDLVSEFSGSTPWRMTNRPARIQQQIRPRFNLLVPLSSMQEESGTLWLIPGSHCYGPRQQPLRQELKRKLSLQLAPGDLLLLHNNLFFRQGRIAGDGAAAVWLTLQY